MIFYPTINKYTSLTCTSLSLRILMKLQHLFPYNSLKDKSKCFFIFSVMELLVIMKLPIVN